ncbi:MAG: thiol reductant ABC exporter subunit CydC [Aquabacterium sp.]|nr:thiol reductant ABC exporter subunit CydC [Aquabacterium sp.]
MSRPMTLKAGWKALAPFFRTSAQAGRWLALGGFLAVLTLVGSLGLLGLSGAFLTGAAIAGLAPATAAAFNFFMPGAGVRFFAVLRTVSRWGDRVTTHEGVFRWLAGLRVWLYGRLSRLSPNQLAGRHSGDLLNRLMRDIDALDNLHPRVLLPLAAAAVVLSTLVLVFVLVAPGLAWLPLLVLAGAVVILPLAGWWLGSRLLPSLIHQRAALRANLLDDIEGLEDWSLHAPAWAQQRALTLATSDAWLRTQRHSARRAAALRAAVTLGIGLLAWVALGLLASEPTTSRVSGPWITALVLLLLGCAEALLPLAGACLDLPGTAAAAQRVQQLAEQPPALRFADHGPQPVDGSIRIQNLCFEWDSHTPVFKDWQLEIRHGEHVLLTGESGGGKSTLIQLLTRFADPQHGSIQVGGAELQSLDEPTLRRHITCATQFTWAKTATLADNLRLARPDATDAELLSVLALVGLDPAEMGWQDGLSTWVEEGGASLSGGQRRRLSIARALLTEAPITLLDEPSEGLDLASERELVQRVTAHLRGRTLLWVSHREDLNHTFDRMIRIPA